MTNKTPSQMNRYVSRKKIRGCPVHMSLLDKAVESLIERGYFEKEKLLEVTGFIYMADAIRWDYLRDFMAKDHDMELIPVAQSFFNEHTLEEEHLAPTKFLATGHGKKTAGYAAINPENGHIVIGHFRNRNAQATGVIKAVKEFRKVAERQLDLKISEDDPNA